MKDVVLFSKLGRRVVDLQEKSLMAYLLELSQAVAREQFETVATLIAEMTASDAVLLRLEKEYFSGNFSPADQAFLRGESKPKAGQHHKINSLLKANLVSLGRFEIDAFSENDTLIANKIAKHLAQDVVRSKQYNQVIRDTQTGFFGRELFFDFLGQEFNRSLRYQAPLSLVLMDIDGFSRVANADVVLSKTAGRIQSEIRQGDFIARLSENTFALIEPITTGQNASESASRILSKFKHLPILIQETPLQIHLSMGIATLSIQDEVPMRLLERADRAMQAAKRLGGNQIVLHD